MWRRTVCIRGSAFDRLRRGSSPFAPGPFWASRSLAARRFWRSWPLDRKLAALVGLYELGSFAYSVRLKREPVVDVFVLAGLYVIRVLAGGFATNIPISTWLLAFAMFLFLSLAFVKRYTELFVMKGALAGRGYVPGDDRWMPAIGISSGYMAVLVLALYVNAPEVARLYDAPAALWWLVPILLFWVTRLWFRASREMSHDDPGRGGVGRPDDLRIGTADPRRALPFRMRTPRSVRRSSACK